MPFWWPFKQHTACFVSLLFVPLSLLLNWRVYLPQILGFGYGISLWKISFALSIGSSVFSNARCSLLVCPKLHSLVGRLLKLYLLDVRLARLGTCSKKLDSSSVILWICSFWSACGVFHTSVCPINLMGEMVKKRVKRDCGKPKCCCPPLIMESRWVLSAFA